MKCVAKYNETGEVLVIPFDNEVFLPIYEEFCVLLVAMWDHPYHGPRLRSRLREHFIKAW